MAATTVAAVLAISGILVVANNLTGSGRIPGGSSSTSTGRSASVLPGFSGGLAPAPSSRISNVVLIVADDLDWNLWNRIPRLRALARQGTTFTNYVVSDSLCCPSRTSLLRGQYVHNHMVVSNDSATGGGWPVFRDDGYPKDCLATWLHDAGVRTGLIGKYLNEFPATTAEQTSVQPGWDDFVVPISHMSDYRGYDYQVDDNGTIVSYGHAPRDFLNDVLDDRAREFLGSAGDHFFLELSTFTPHLPSPVAPRHRGSHAGEQAPRDPSYGTAVVDAPSWLAGLPPIRPALAAHLDRTWVRRAESAESVADSVDAVQQALLASGHADDTLVLVTSDNGFHVGSHRMHRGKRSAFDSDTVVPLVVIGPGVARGLAVTEMASEIDLAPTVAHVLGAQSPSWSDGRSLWPLLPDGSAPSGVPVTWRTGVLSESLGVVRPGDPDYQLIAPPSFASLRTRAWLYVEYADGEKELYDRVGDPYETVNVAGSAPAATLEALSGQLHALTACSGAACRIADSLPEP